MRKERICLVVDNVKNEAYGREADYMLSEAFESSTSLSGHCTINNYKKNSTRPPSDGPYPFNDVETVEGLRLRALTE